MSDKEKVMNLTPFHLESRYGESGFALEFFCNTSGGKKVRVIMNFEFWWIQSIARELWAQIRKRRESVERATASMTEEPKCES